jgi:hypothetical protein
MHDEMLLVQTQLEMLAIATAAVALVASSGPAPFHPTMIKAAGSLGNWSQATCLRTGEIIKSQNAPR